MASFKKEYNRAFRSATPLPIEPDYFVGQLRDYGKIDLAKLGYGKGEITLAGLSEALFDGLYTGESVVRVFITAVDFDRQDRTVTVYCCREMSYSDKSRTKIYSRGYISFQYGGYSYNPTMAETSAEYRKERYDGDRRFVLTPDMVKK